MTKEQEEAIEMLEDIENNTWTTKYIMSSDSKKAETVLNMLKEKDKKIEIEKDNYKNLSEYVSEIAKKLGLEEDGTIDEIYAQIEKLKEFINWLQLKISENLSVEIYMANFINDNTPYTKDTKELENEKGIRTTDFTLKYFERKAKK